MILKQIFKTFEGARKRAMFENAHCNGKYHYRVIRFFEGKPDTDPVTGTRWKKYTWRLERVTKKQAT